jgi:hypothetical protein
MLLPSINRELKCEGFDFINHVKSLPRQVEIRSAEVAVSCGLLVNGPEKVQVRDDAAGPEVKQPADNVLNSLVGLRPVPRVSQGPKQTGHAMA